MRRDEGKLKIENCRLQIADCRDCAAPFTLRPSPLALLLPLVLCVIFIAAARGDESLAERRQRVAAMNPAQKEQLRRRQEQFAALDPGEQQRLRRLHEQLDADPDATQLRQIMQHYSDWLKALPPYRRAELMELAPPERIKRIKKLLQEQTPAAKPKKRLNEQDAAGLVRWIERYTTANEPRLLETLPAAQRGKVAQLSPPIRRRMLIWILWQQWQSAPGGKPPLGDRELAELRLQLSPASRERLKGKSPAEQWKIVSNWLRQLFWRSGGARHLDDPLPAGQEEELADFFEYELTDAERDRLLNLPGDDMQKELRKMYLARFKPTGPSGTAPARPKKHPPGKKPDKGHRGDKAEKGEAKK